MRTRLSKTWGCVLLSTIILCSCKKDEVKPESDPKDNWYYGYFRGEIAGNRFNLQNTSDDRKILSFPCSFNNSLSSNPVNFMATDIYYTDYSILAIALYGPVEVGVRYITTPIWQGVNDNGCIRLKLYSSPEKTPVSHRATYVPDPENPFRVEVFDVKWIDPIHPIIEVKLNGVLYNMDNPQDVMVIQGTYGGAC